jgi:hypothetical protein
MNHSMNEAHNGFVRSWNKEFRNMNELELQFEYSHSYIHFLAFLKIGFKIAYRIVQGIGIGLPMKRTKKARFFII